MVVVGNQSAVYTPIIAPYLVILRVANRRALTSDTISGTIGSIRFRSQVTADGDESFSDGDPRKSVEVDGEAPSGLGARSEDAIQEAPLWQGIKSPWESNTSLGLDSLASFVLSPFLRPFPSKTQPHRTFQLSGP